MNHRQDHSETLSISEVSSVLTPSKINLLKRNVDVTSQNLDKNNVKKLWTITNNQENTSMNILKESMSIFTKSDNHKQFQSNKQFTIFD